MENLKDLTASEMDLSIQRAKRLANLDIDGGQEIGRLLIVNGCKGNLHALGDIIRILRKRDTPFYEL